jgi:hypothetical protein
VCVYAFILCLCLQSETYKYRDSRLTRAYRIDLCRTMKAYVRFDVLTAMIMKITIFGDLTQRSVTEIYLNHLPDVPEDTNIHTYICFTNCKLKVHVYISLLVRRWRPGAIRLQINGRNLMTMRIRKKNAKTRPRKEKENVVQDCVK